MRRISALIETVLYRIHRGQREGWRLIDIELEGQEVITIHLDNVDSNPEDVSNILKEGQCRVSVWMELVGRIAHAQKALKSMFSQAREDKLTNRNFGILDSRYYARSIQSLTSLSCSTGSMDDAMHSFEGVLAEKPTNVYRILHALMTYPQAFKLFQEILQLSPYCIPNSRTGIGLCLWAMEMAKRTPHNSTDWLTQLLLGLDLSKQDQKAFNANQKNAAVANVLRELFLRKDSYKRALKLAERTIPFADTLTLPTEGNIKAARILHADSAIGTAQLQIQNDEIAASIYTFDLLLQPLNPPRSVEAIIMLASLPAHPHPEEACGVFDRAIYTAGYINDDLDMHESLDWTTQAVKETLRLSEANKQIDPRLLKNMGALQHMEGNLAEIRALYEYSLTKAADLGPDVGEGISTSMLYNLARVCEYGGDIVMAKEAYDKLLAGHPEYVDGEFRVNSTCLSLSDFPSAKRAMKQTMASQNSNLNVRANFPKPAKDFVFATLEDQDKHDVYSLSAAGWIQYHQSRESRDPSPKGLEERRRSFQRSAEFYDKALLLDPLCAFAAQGLAIVIAEDALWTFGGGPATSGGGDPQKRMRNARDTLDIFAKIRESLNDGSAYLNMGHCYHAQDEFDRAIETSVRFYSGHNVSVLLCFDKVILYNIAMIQQKAAELLFGLSPSKCTLKDLEWSMLRRGDEHLATQKEFEAEAQAKLEAARQRRQMEKDKVEALERKKFEELRQEAERLAEERRKAREQAHEWTREVQMEK
ncbi:hypothetical protein EDB19DRAFT_1892715 [Suillus lakei]|nr:hypothetical protein EDB19DRAFT_1892715 [Suillus lakei]